MTDDDRPYVVESPTRIRLGPVAIQFARAYGLSVTEMARYLLDRHQSPDDETTANRGTMSAEEMEAAPPSMAGAQEDFLPDVTPSANAED
jgi:hypothetical protein